MRVDLPSLRTVGAASTAPTLLSQWRVGTVLQAVTVVDPAGRLFLDIGNDRYAARLAWSDSGMPRNGERLQLTVLRESPVLAFEASRLGTSAQESPPSVDALRRFLPRQDSAAPLVANLSLIANNDSDFDLPPAVLQAATRLWQALPDADTMISPQRLRQAITDSGVFLEAKLGGQPTPSGIASVAHDLKALLLQFSSTLAASGARANGAVPGTAPAPLPTFNGALQPLSASTPSLPSLPDTDLQLHELARQSEGAVARLTTLQVANSMNDPSTHALCVELPVRFSEQVNMLRLRIEREESNNAAATAEALPAVWRVEAALDLGAAGALHARITLQGQQVDVQLRASAADIVSALSTQSEQLAALLRESGLDVHRIACSHGLPPNETAVRMPRLLDMLA